MKRSITAFILLFVAASLFAENVRVIIAQNPPSDEVTAYVLYEVQGQNLVQIRSIDPKDPANQIVVGTTTNITHVVTGLNPGKYRYVVKAVNFWGESVQSDEKATPTGKAGKPTIDSLQLAP